MQYTVHLGSTGPTLLTAQLKVLQTPQKVKLHNLFNGSNEFREQELQAVKFNNKKTDN